MLRPKRFVTPFWAWARIALYNFDEYLADFLKRIGKYHAYSSYKDYCKRHRRLAVFLKYEYHSLRLRPSALRTLRGSLPVAGEEEHRFGIFGPLPRIEDLENRASLPLGPDNLETRGVGRRIDRDREIVERSRVPASAGCEQQGRSGKKRGCNRFIVWLGVYLSEADSW